MKSYRSPDAMWLASPNYTAGRGGSPVTSIVLHTMVASIDSATARFEASGSHVSAHYGVSLSGTLVQWVDECDAAWHSGDWDRNMESIGIEHEDLGDYNAPRPDSLYRASATLVRGICARYGIQIDSRHVIAHRQVIPTGCPDALDVDRIVRAASTPIIEDTPMTDSECLEIARGIVECEYDGVLHRGAESVAAADGWAAKVAQAIRGRGPGVYSVLNDFRAERESSGDLRADFARDHPA